MSVIPVIICAAELAIAGYSGDHPILRRRIVDDARKHEAGLSGSNCSDRNPVSQHHSVKKSFVRLK
jgi:hypothetical protein